MKGKLLIAIAALIVTSVSYAETNTGENSASGDIDLTLDLGDSGGGTQEFIIETSLDGGSNSVDLSESGAGGIDNTIGSIAFTGTNVGSDAILCQVEFEGSNSSADTQFQLVKADGTDNINYVLSMTVTTNQVSNAFVTEIRPDSPPSATQLQSGASGQENNCSINVSNIRIVSFDDLTNKNGVYTDTLTYTMTAI